MLTTLLLAASLPTGVFRLARDPAAPLDGPCDVYTRLILDKAELAGPIAFLGERFAGECGEPLDRNARHYPLFSEATDPCGSVTWTGTFLHGGASQLRVTDHRARRCDDPIRAVVIVEETAPSGATVTLYAHD